MDNLQSLRNLTQRLFDDTSSKKSYYKVTIEDINSPIRVFVLCLSLVQYSLTFTSELLIILFGSIIPFSLLIINDKVNLLIILVVLILGYFIIFKYFSSTFFRSLSLLCTTSFFYTNYLLFASKNEIAETLSKVLNAFGGIIFMIAFYFVGYALIAGILIIVFRFIADVVKNSKSYNSFITLSSIFFSILYTALYLILYLKISNIQNDQLATILQDIKGYSFNLIILVSALLSIIPNKVIIDKNRVLSDMKKNFRW